jgi:hypothetical protein
MTWTLEGAQPAPSLYRTVNLILVEVVPEPGVAMPALRIGALCDPPLQLAAIASSDVSGASASATAVASATTIAPGRPSRAGLRLSIGETASSARPDGPPRR